MHCGAPGSRSNAPGIYVLAYGRSEDFGGIIFLSEQSGLRCSNGDGHGFRLSRRVQAVE